MKVIETDFKGLKILEPAVFGDSRGYFLESYNKATLLKHGIEISFVQDNQSSSRRGVLRGLHFQNAPYAQTKLVRVLSGAILDVVVDIRKTEATFGKHFAIELSSEKKNQLLVPKGFAHGFIVLSEMAEVLYKCDEYYTPAAEGGILFNDPALNIDWQLRESEFLLSDKDKVHPVLAKAVYNF